MTFQQIPGLFGRLLGAEIGKANDQIDLRLVAHLIGLAPSHFKESEIHLLCQYCTAVALARYYSERIGSATDDGKFFTRFEASSRLAGNVATKLRITPQARFDSRAADRNTEAISADTIRPWEMQSDYYKRTKGETV